MFFYYQKCYPMQINLYSISWNSKRVWILQFWLSYLIVMWRNWKTSLQIFSMPTIGSVTSVVELSGAELIYNIDFYRKFYVVKLYYRFGNDLIGINHWKWQKTDLCNQTLQAFVENLSPKSSTFYKPNSFHNNAISQFTELRKSLFFKRML